MRALFFALVLLPLYAFSQEKLTVEGTLFERGTKIPLAEINIFILPYKLKASTDSKGHFVFEDVPAGEFQFVVSQTGYQKLEKFDESYSEQPHRVLYLEKDNYSAFETTIVDKKQKRDDSVKVLKQAQFLNLPGSGGDPVKAVQNLPGVNRVSGYSSQVVIQGSAPQDTKYDLDGQEIPIVFHFGGLTSVVMPEAVEQVDYFSAGYGSEYSRALGGVISLKTRNPDVKDRDRKGFFFVDTLKSGALVEGKINDHSSYLISGRYSYIGLFLRQATKNNENFNLTVAPEFSDLTMIYQNKLDEQNDLKINLIASKDSLGFLLKEPAKDDPGFRGSFRNETDFARIIPQWTKKWDLERTSRLSAGFGQDSILVDVGDNFFNLKSLSMTTRGEWEQKMNSSWTMQLGFDNQYTRSQVDLKLPVFSNSGGVGNPIATSQTREASISSRNADVGLYWRNEIKATDSPWTFLPSLRLDQFGYTKEKFISPRLGLRHLWSDSLILKMAGGVYYQPPQPQEVSAEYGNPDVKSPSALHLTLGFEKDFRENSDRGVTLNTSFFRRNFRNLVIQSSQMINRNGVMVAEAYNNEGGGQAQGIENQIKFNFAPWEGWVSYTLSESKRWDPQHEEYNFQYDQTHNLNIVMSYDYVRNWKFSGRYRYVTGSPYTPVVGSIFDSDNDVYIPVRGAFYSARQGAFSQLDIRIDKKWILDKEIWSVYLDIQNSLNLKNPEQIRYSYDYSQKQDVTGLPFLPALGIKGEF